MISDMSSLFSRFGFSCLLVLSGFWGTTMQGKEPVEKKPWPEVTFPSPEERASAFLPGEEYHYRAGWGIFRNVGRINVKTDMVERDEKEAFHLETSFKTSGFIRALYGVDANSNTYLDPIEWRLLWIDAEGKAGKGEARNITEVDYEKEFLHFTDATNPDQSYSIKLPYSHPLDFISALLQTRAWDLEVGSSYPIFIAGDGKVYLADIDVVEKKTISTAFGKKEAFKLVPRMEFRPSGILAKGGRVAVWITDDELRLPVLLEVKIAIGTAKLRLEYYKSPDVELSKKKRRSRH
jgi:hypothetical protein